jgi:hypothetical protein
MKADEARPATVIGADGPNDRLWRIGTEVTHLDGKALNRLFYEFYPAKAGGRRIVQDATTMISPQQWYHVAVTYGGGKRRLYLDGRCIDECDAAAVLRPTNVPLTIGARGDEAEWFRGQIDYVALYDHTLDSSQVAQHYRFFAKCHVRDEELPRLFAWRAACQALFCSNEFIYVE